MSTPRSVAQEVATHVGGPDNVEWLGTCTTRLRFVVRDETHVDFDALGRTPGVLQAVHAGGQVQVVIGTHVNTVRDALIALDGWKGFDDDERTVASAKRKPLDVVFDFLGGTFQPLLAPITGAAMVQVLTLLLTQVGWLDPESPTALILDATGNALFYFLPLFVAFTASRKLNVNPYVGATIAAALLHPSFTGIGATGDIASAFGMPLFMYSYASSMFPSLLVAIALWALDRLLKRVIPQALQQIFVPTFELLILVPVTALLFGPIGVLVGNGIAGGTSWLIDTAPFLFYLIVPALWVFLVSFGIHWALLSIAIAELASSGSTALLGAGAGYQYAMMGVALAMLIRAARERKKSLRDTAAAATTAVFIGGITEPTLYGLVLPYRRVLGVQMIGAASAGVVLGIFGVVGIGFAPAPVLGLPLMQPIIGGALAMIVGIAVPVILLQVWGYEPKKAPQAADSGFRGAVDANAFNGSITVSAPLSGTVADLSETGDAVFAGGLLGPGTAIRPSGDTVYAPVAGTVVAAPASGHAIGLRTDEGLELLIHVGIDTVKLNGRHFDLKISQGARVERGQPLLEFDAAAIAAAGYSLVTPVVVTNIAAGQTASFPVSSGEIRAGDTLFTVDPVAV